jgi:hypothetical protein
VRAAGFFATGFLATAFFATAFFATGLAAAFATGFFATAFAAGFAAARATGFFAAGFFAATRATGFFAAGFAAAFAAGFFATAFAAGFDTARAKGFFAAGFAAGFFAAVERDPEREAELRDAAEPELRELDDRAVAATARGVETPASDMSPDMSAWVMNDLLLVCTWENIPARRFLAGYPDGGPRRDPS